MSAHYSPPTPKDPPIPPNIVSKPKFAVIGGSGVTVAGVDRFSFQTPFGPVLNISFLDSEQKVVFVNRHQCTHMDENGGPTYAPPHQVNFHAIIYALKALNARAICAIGSTGTLQPLKVPVGSIVMPDDFVFALPEPVTYWGKCKMGLFDPAEGEHGRIHFAPATGDDKDWVDFRMWVQSQLAPVLSQHKDKIVMAKGQTSEVWPCVDSTSVSNDVRCAYLQTPGPRFETRSEIKSYRQMGDIVGMTCASEWTLASELKLPYVLICAIDNSANGLSTHAGGPVQEYLDHKGAISTVTSALVHALTHALSSKE